jgi:hypothetical protein
MTQKSQLFFTARLVVVALLLGWFELFFVWQDNVVVMAPTDESSVENAYRYGENDEQIDPDWWKPLVDQVASPFRTIPNQSWCVPRPVISSMGGESNISTTRNNNGLYLVKIPKTASSTAAGVTIQIARNVALLPSHHQHHDSSGSPPPPRIMECTHHVDHGMAHVDRQDPFFLWTVVRHPIPRAISHYFFELVSRRSTMMTSSGMIAEVKRQQNFQFRYVAQQRVVWTSNTSNNSNKIKNNGNIQTRYQLEHLKTNKENILEMLEKDVLGAFHFIGVSERLDESLVVLAMILSLELRDVMVLSSKVNGGLDDGGFDGTCVKIQPAYTTPEVDRYLAEEFPIGNHDFLLYAVANRSLDLTIDTIGKELFQRKLQKYRSMKQYAQDRCLRNTIFPCVTAGQPPLPESQKSCFEGDIGCGHICVQEVLQQYYKRMKS